MAMIRTQERDIHAHTSVMTRSLRALICALFVLTTLASLSTLTLSAANAAPAAASCADERAAYSSTRDARNEAAATRKATYLVWVEAKDTYKADRTRANRDAMNAAKADFEAAKAAHLTAVANFATARTNLNDCLNPLRAENLRVGDDLYGVHPGEQIAYVNFSGRGFQPNTQHELVIDGYCNPSGNDRRCTAGLYTDENGAFTWGDAPVAVCSNNPPTVEIGVADSGYSEGAPGASILRTLVINNPCAAPARASSKAHNTSRLTSVGTR